MILKHLVRAHFEQTGEFSSFPLMSLLETESAKLSKEPKDLYFECLGYESDATLGAAERFNYRKLASKVSYRSLKSMLKVKTDSEVDEILARLGCSSAKGLVKPIKDTDPDVTKLSRLLAEYVSSCNEIVLSRGKEYVPFHKYLDTLRYPKTRKDMKDILDSEKSWQIFKIAIPKFVYKKNCTPLISQKTFFVPFRLTEQQHTNLIKDAFSHALFRSLDVPDQVYVYAISQALGYSLTKEDAYLKLIDWSHSLDMSISKIFDLCGLKLPDRLGYYQKYGVVPYLVSSERIRVYSSNSINDEFVVLNPNQFYGLVSSGIIKTLDWDKETGMPFIFYNGKEYLATMYSVQSKDDFSGGLS
jgi:hypothetical protein